MMESYSNQNIFISRNYEHVPKLLLLLLLLLLVVVVVVVVVLIL
jgi:hypothetical protein